MDDPWEHYAKHKNPDTHKKHILYDSIYMKYQNGLIYRNRKISGCQELGKGTMRGVW